MKKITLIILLLAVCFAGFAKQKKAKKKKTGTNITSVSIHRTLCFGRCPDYTVELQADGTITYTGVRFTDDTGIFTKKIEVARAMDIIRQFATYRVDTCKDRYENRIQDVPGLIITVKYSNATKTINSANFGPGFLQQLASQVDEVGRKAKDDDSWKKIGMPKVNY